MARCYGRSRLSHHRKSTDKKEDIVKTYSHHTFRLFPQSHVAGIGFHVRTELYARFQSNPMLIDWPFTAGMGRRYKSDLTSGLLADSPLTGWTHKLPQNLENEGCLGVIATGERGRITGA